jgi:hypothetical protein
MDRFPHHVALSVLARSLNLEPQRGEPFGSPLLFGVKWKGFFAHMIAKAQKAPAEKAFEKAKVEKTRGDVALIDAE